MTNVQGNPGRLARGNAVSWFKEYESTIGAIPGIYAAFVAVLQLFVVGPMNQRFKDYPLTWIDDSVCNTSESTA